ncbi:MAG TPA: response regulator [bacterium]|nr:response regulator [bacterium]
MRIMVVDDERHVIDTISHIVRTELADGFEIVGSASSGRQAIALSMERKPDIVIMDVRMPGVSGIEAIRELRRRGSSAAFILATAYERFDIAQEAVGLGVVEYLLKPIVKEALAAALRRAATIVSERSTLENRDLESREREEWARDFAEAALLHGITLGERFGDRLRRYCMALGLDEPYARIGVVAIARPLAEESGAVYARLRDSLRYKTRMLVGPFAAGRCIVLMPLRSMADAAMAAQDFQTILTKEFGTELAVGTMHLGLGNALELVDARLSLAGAMQSLVSGRFSGNGEPHSGFAALAFHEEDALLGALDAGDVDRARLVFESLLAGAVAPQEESSAVESCRLDTINASRIMSLIGQIVRSQVTRGRLDAAMANVGIDLSGLAAALTDAYGLGANPFVAMARSQFETLVSSAKDKPNYSSAVAKALEYIQSNYGGQVSLEQAADLVGLSPNRLSKLFVAETGHGFSDCLIEYRIEKAKSLLRAPGASIKRVSLECGYPDSNYFSRLFKKMTGSTPSAYSSSTLEDTDEVD